MFRRRFEARTDQMVCATGRTAREACSGSTGAADRRAAIAATGDKP
jgi:hypothetical protein